MVPLVFSPGAAREVLDLAKHAATLLSEEGTPLSEKRVEDDQEMPYKRTLQTVAVLGADPPVSSPTRHPLVQQAEALSEVVNDKLQRQTSTSAYKELAEQCEKLKSTLTQAMGDAVEKNELTLFDELQKAESLISSNLDLCQGKSLETSPLSPTATQLPVVISSPPHGQTPTGKSKKKTRKSVKNSKSSGEFGPGGVPQATAALFAEFDDPFATIKSSPLGVTNSGGDADSSLWAVPKPKKRFDQTAQIDSLITRDELLRLRKELDERNSQVDQLTQELRKRITVERDLAAELAEQKQSLAYAKEMWLRESSRASALTQELESMETKLLESDGKYNNLAKKYHDITRELAALKHLVKLDSHSERAMSYSVRPKESSVSPKIYTSSSAYIEEDHRLQQDTTSSYLSHRDWDWSSLEDLPPPPSPYSNYDTVAIERTRAIILYNQGVGYQDSTIQIGFKSEFKGLTGNIEVFYGNLTPAPLFSFQVEVFCQTPAALDLAYSPLPDRILPREQVSHAVVFTCAEPFHHAPILQVKYLLPDSSPALLRVALPIYLTKFVEGRSLSFDEFSLYWEHETFLSKEASCLVYIDKQRYGKSLLQLARVLKVNGAFQLLAGFDTSDNVVVLAGGFPPSKCDSSIPVSIAIIRFELGTGKYRDVARVCVRSDSRILALAVRDILKTLVSVSEP